MRYNVLPFFALASNVFAAPLQATSWEDLSVPFELPAVEEAPKPLPLSPTPQNPWTEKKGPSHEPATAAPSIKVALAPADDNQNRPNSGSGPFGISNPFGSSQSRPPPSGSSSSRGPPPPSSGGQTRQREDAIRYNLRRVNTALTALDDSLARKPRYWRSQQELDEYFHRVWDLGNVVVNELHNGADDIRYNGVLLNDAEALGLQRQVSTLDTQLSNVVSLIISSKRDVDEIYRRREVLDLLTRAEVDMGNFIDAIISRLSGLSQTIGRGIRSRFVSNLERAVRDYRR